MSSPSPEQANLRHRGFAPLVVLGAIWTAAVLEFARTTGIDGPELVPPVVVAIGVALTWKLTEPAPPIAPPAGRLRAQLAFLAVYTIALIATWLHDHHVIDSPVFLPLDRAARAVGPVVGDPNFAINPLSMVVLPGLVLWGLGAGRRDLGLGRGRHTLRVAALWCAIPAVFLAANLALGTLSVTEAGRRAIGHVLQNGPVEEIYWRGFVQTRLQRFGAAWAVVGTALVFGLSHLGSQLVMSHGDVLRAAAGCILFQSMMGVAFGAMFLRTQSLVASSAFHVLLNLSLDVGRLLARGA